MSANFPIADFTPQLAGYTGQGAFRFWCQKVLPIVYDDSLSYYELLNKVVVYLNNVIKDVATCEDNVGSLYTAFKLLEEFVNNYTLVVNPATVEEILTRHPEWTTTVMDGSISLRKTTRDLIVVRNLQSYLTEPLSSDNIEEAFELALQDGLPIYIPAGEYVCNLYTDADCDIILDKNCVLTPKTGETFESIKPALLAENCSVNIRGGVLKAGDNYLTRKYVYPMFAKWNDEYYPNDYEFPAGSTVLRGINQAHGIIELNNCHDCLIEGVKSVNSNYGSCVQLTDCKNVEIARCDFNNCINSFIHIVYHCVNVNINHCSFINSIHRDGISWCYAVYTGAVDTADDFVPPIGLVYESNYVYNTEDCGLDTHGARNVIMRNNIVLQTVCALTAYNDNRRVVRPSGWRMANVLLENNYCSSDKSPMTNEEAARQGVAADNNLRHSFVFVGSSFFESEDVEEEVDISLIGGYFDFCDCVIKNNFFETSSNMKPTICTSGLCVNYKYENNVLINGYNSRLPMFMRRCINFVVANNVFVECNQSTLFQSCGVLLNNEGLTIKASVNSFVRAEGLDNSRNNVGLPTAVLHGDKMVRGGQLFESLSIGITSLNDRVNPSLLTDTCQVSDGVAKVSVNRYLPNQRLTLTNQVSGTVYSCFVDYLVSYTMLIIKTTTGANLPNGDYNISVNNAEVKSVKTPWFTTVKVSSASLRSEPATSGSIVTNLTEGTDVYCYDIPFTAASWRACIVFGATAVIHGYILATSLN